MALNCIQIRHAGALYKEQLSSQLIYALFRHDFSDLHYDNCAKYRLEAENCPFCEKKERHTNVLIYRKIVIRWHLSARP